MSTPDTEQPLPASDLWADEAILNEDLPWEVRWVGADIAAILVDGTKVSGRLIEVSDLGIILALAKGGEMLIPHLSLFALTLNGAAPKKSGAKKKSPKKNSTKKGTT